MGCATLQDKFDSIFGTKRGASHILPCDPVSLAYGALSAEDLDYCLALKLTLDEKALVAAAKVDREVLELLRSNIFHSLAAQADLRSTPTVLRGADLATRLRACGVAREDRDKATLADAGARSLGMFSVEGNIALSEILDEVSNSPQLNQGMVVQPRITYNDEIKRLDVTHAEVNDAVVQENIRADLEAHSVDEDLVALIMSW